MRQYRGSKAGLNIVPEAERCEEITSRASAHERCRNRRVTTFDGKQLCPGHLQRAMQRALRQGAA